MGARIGCSPKDAVQYLKSGEPVALPTETVYGLAAPLFNEEAIAKIYRLKQRPFNNPLIVHVLGQAQLEAVAYVNASALKLIHQFWPGPLTIILPKKPCVSSIVTAQQSTVAVRAPQAPLFREVIELLGEPLVAPSANKFQQVSPTCAQHVMRGMGDCISYILDGGPCQFGLESTILFLADEEHPKLLRYGPITQEAIEAVLGKKISIYSTQELNATNKKSPGLYKKHYSPQTPLSLVEHIPQDKSANRGYIYRQRPSSSLNQNEYYLSENGDLSEMAHNVFKLLQELDQKAYEEIFIERVPNIGIGKAINERLERASS